MALSRSTGARAVPAFLIAALLLLLLGESTATGAATAEGPKSLFGAHTTDYSTKTIGEFSTALSTSHVPLLLFMFDQNDSESVVGVWQRLIAQVGDAMHLFTLQTGYVASGSVLGKSLIQGFGITSPAVLFFDGILRPFPSRPGSFGKIPIGYTGALTVPKLLRWVLPNISPDLITRVDSDDDLRELFRKYPGFPELPRVLFFPSNGYVGPVIRILSQVFQADAAFGVVVQPFDTEEKASIAKRYGVNSTTDLPAVVVLKPQPSGTVDEAVPLAGVTAKSSVNDIAEMLHEKLPNCAINAMKAFVETQDRTMLDVAQKRKLYIIQELARERVELFGDDADDPQRGATNSRGTTADSAAVVLVTSQAMWQQHCAQMRQGSYCLAVLAERDQMDNAKATLQEAALRIMKSVSVNLRGHVHFVVLDAARSVAIANYFDSGAQGLPDVVLLTATPPRTYFNFVGSYSSENIVRFFLSKTQTKNPVGGSRYITHMIPAYEEEQVSSHNRSESELDADL